ncbi:MAG: ComEC/Rec2 family competence protein [Bacillota bacterium]|nr:ComEC/Rec2 family competence protein [Bacillota bacterium]
MKRKILLISVIFVIICSLLFSYGGSLGIPNWQQIFGFAGLSTFNSNIESPFAVHVIDVGKADSIYIKCEDQNILIDSGAPSLKPKVIDYLKSQHVNTLDLVVASHSDDDHIGNLAKVIKTFYVKRFCTDNEDKSTVTNISCYNNMLSALKSKNIPVEHPKAGQRLNLKHARIDVLAPLNKYNNANDSALVLKITYEKTKFLFTGDIENPAEEDILNSGEDISCDVLKVAHHGSKTSSSQEFLDKANPKYAVISVGPDRNNLPDKLVIDRILSDNIHLFRTDEDGTVIFTSDGEHIKTLTEKSR